MIELAATIFVVGGMLYTALLVALTVWGLWTSERNSMNGDKSATVENEKVLGRPPGTL